MAIRHLSTRRCPGTASMRSSVWVGLLAALLNLSTPGHAEIGERSSNPDESLLVYAIEVIHSRPLQAPFRGYGIYLGKGAIITAAHVIGRWPAFIASPRLMIAGRELTAKIVRRGSLETTDLALLSVDEAELPISLRLRLNPLCREPARPGGNVIVVALKETARSQIVPPQLLPLEDRKNFNTLIRDVGVGDSGSGVFHAEKKCLLGIITTRLSLNYRPESGPERTVDVKQFVPASTIAEFIPPEFRF